MSNIILLSGLNPRLDARNLNILIERASKYIQRHEPQVGDFARMLDGTLRRFTHDHGETIQTTWTSGGAIDHSDVGSFYLTACGHGNYSGGLNPGVPKSRFRDSGENRAGSFWFFRDDHMRAHNSINVLIPCRVWIEQGE